MTAARTALSWPKTRTALWLLGLVCAASAVAGPLAERPTPTCVHTAHPGAQIMYYGGAPVELTIIILLGLEWLHRQDHSRAVAERVAVAPS